MTVAHPNPWHARADELARWALLRMVNRTDRCGGCFVGAGGKVRRTTRPSDGPAPGFVNHPRLVQHFSATAAAHVVGLHAIAPDGTGKWVAVDVDAHPDRPFDPDANERFARAGFDRLTGLGFRPLLTQSNGTGGFHLLALFAEPVPARELFAFGRWLARDHAAFGLPDAPETFPKQRELRANARYGSWLRLVGRHHARDFWSPVWDGTGWRTGADAVEHVLSLAGDSPALIPPDTRAPEPVRAPAPVARAPQRRPGPGPGGETDVFAAYNRAATEEAVGELLQRHGWTPLGRRGPRWDFRRPGKDADTSGNLMPVSGVPIFYGFTDATNVPPDRGLNPSQLRCHLEFGGDFARLAERLRTEGYAPRRPAAPPAAGSDGTAAPPPPPPPPPAPSGAGEGAGDPEPVHEDFLDPHRLGRLLVPRAGELPTVIYHRAEWWEWRGGRYVSVPDDDFEKRAWVVLRGECEAAHRVAVAAWGHGGRQGPRPKVVKLDTRKVGNAVTAAASMCHLDGAVAWPVLLAADPADADHIPRLRPAPEPREFVACANGLIDVAELFATGRAALHPATPLYFTPAALPVAFDPAAECPTFLRFLDRVTEGDAERQSLLQEIAGYLLRFDTRFQQFFLLTGDGANGKSTFLAALRALIGDHNYASVPLEEFGERFTLGATLGKLVNAVAEVGELDKVAEAKLKSFVGGDLMTFDRKNKAPVSARPTARLLLSTNTPPRFADRTEGVWRRYQLVPFTAVISAEERVRGMSEPEWWVSSGELPGVLNWALAGLLRLHRANGFTSSAACETAKAEHRELCNPHRLFLGEHVREQEGAVLRCVELFAAYVEWCRQRRYLPLADGNFGAEVRKVFRRVTKSRPRTGRERQNVYSGVTWTEGRPDGLLTEYDRRRRDATGWTPDDDRPR
ncbi:phage/plasmid primase, P4 family [Gemmata sp. JC717]|uniref:phage/plasmid primase, P4 family n=1 Tax=Gemmata algarum TaxID=2975278 RepID=UPI0021BB905F|nr:phage/plasmid primase, P4 family [Gemmata algarum]MDY3557046.1 phage/plasmid primase, P4 family [Gemmata algarum]